MHWLTRSAPGTEKIRCCPTAAKPASAGGITPMNRQHVGGTFIAWGEFRPYVSTHEFTDRLYHGSYSMNNWLSVPDATASMVIGIAAASPRRTVDDFWRNEDTRGAAEIPAFANSSWWCSWPKDNDRPPDFDGQIDPFPCGCRDAMRRFCINRHDGCINAAFLDGSVRRVGLKQLWTLKWHRSFDTTGQWTTAGGARRESWPSWMRNLKDY